MPRRARGPPPSARASPPIIRLIASFTILASSRSPTWWTVGPIARITGSTRVERLARPGDDEAQVPGAHDRRVAADRRAQVRRRTPPRRCEATRAEAAGETVLVSTRTVPGRAAPRISGRDRLERLVVRQGRQDDVDPLGEADVRRCDRGAARFEGRRPSRASGCHDELVSGVEQALCDRRAHVAETDQPDGESRVVRVAHCPV